MNKDLISLIIFAVCVVLFLIKRVPMTLTALIGATSMVLFGCCSFSEAFSQFGSSTVMLICAMMIVGQAAFDTGLAQIVANKIVSLARGNERAVVMIGTLGCSIISAFLSNVATLAVFISILTSICAVQENIKMKNVTLPIAMGAVLGGSATLVGSTPQLTANGIIEDVLGYGFSFFDFSFTGGIVIIALVLYVGFIGYPLGKKIWGNREDYNKKPINDSAKKTDVVYSKSKMIVMAVIFVVTLVLFVTCDSVSNYLKTSFGYKSWTVAMISMLSAFACVITGCISHKNAMKSINWELVVRFAACLAIAEGINISGGGEMLASAFMNVVGSNPSPMFLFAAFVLLIMIMTQFLANSTTILIVLPIAMSVTAGLGYNSFAYAVGITLGGAMAVATPLANSTIAMALVADYEFADYLKYAGLMTLISYIIILITVPMIFPLV